MLIASLMAAVALTEGVLISGGARAYVESAYMSTTGNYQYQNPVAEQVVYLRLDFGRYGSVFTDGWMFSDISGTRQNVHRRSFSCYEGTLVYQYGLPLDDEGGCVLNTSGGLLWDWLGGYEAKHGTPLFGYAYQSLDNRIVTPYWNVLSGAFNEGRAWTRVRLGVQRDCTPVKSLTLTPFADVSWGDPAKFEANYGALPDDRILGGSFMFTMIGIVSKWYFADNWYLWGRYRHMFVVDGQARRLMRERTVGPRDTEHPFFGIGVGVCF